MLRIKRQTVLVCSGRVAMSFFKLLVTRVMRGAQRLKVGGVCEQVHVAVVRDDVVNRVARSQQVHLLALHAQRLQPQMVGTQLLPTPCVIQMRPRAHHAHPELDTDGRT